MTEPARAATFTTPSLFASAARVFDLSLGQMLWSRRSVFLGVLLGGPVVLAVALRDRRHAAHARDSASTARRSADRRFSA